MAASLAYAPIFLVILVVLYRLLRRQKKKPEGKAETELPPGSMGWPSIGETLQLYSQDPNVFFSSREKRHGEIFKRHLLGCPSVLLASPEAARFVLVTKAQLLKPTYPSSMERLIGPAALFFHQGEHHTRLWKLVQASLSIEANRNMVPDIDAVVASAMDSWHGGHVVNTFHEMKKISFDVGMLMIFGRLEARYREELKENYFMVDNGYNSFPINIPGTPYRKALQDEKGEVLTDDQMADNIIRTFFAAQDTTASVMTWIVKYLHDNPKLLEAVKAEHKSIERLIEETDQQEAVADVEYKVYLIPKGWKVMPLFRNIHHNPEFFADPREFDPSRFEVVPKPNTFMPFGSGVHACPGNELAKLEMLIVAHHLVSNFRVGLSIGHFQFL
ncbi:Abscisic acid 8'-hydroxylase 2 [Hibiscus syriacus]|uniref:Abscisic acid 8'-hydroxylase 2 n=1 Tax=Hibiscus syriacus TaxID=106335 RepID=A0A6A3B5M3_HIBSY|nr:Abscisic acid 8'-hydroxylase 2 [Hibiscus syriacus]